MQTNTIVNQSTLQTSTLTATNAQAQFITFSSLTGSTMQTNTIVNQSTLQTSTLTATNAQTQFITFSSLTGSTMQTNTIVNQFTMQTSTLTASTLIVNSSLTVNSTLTTRFTTFSSLIGSTMQTNTLFGDAFVASTMALNAVNPITITSATLITPIGTYSTSLQININGTLYKIPLYI